MSEKTTIAPEPVKGGVDLDRFERGRALASSMAAEGRARDGEVPSPAPQPDETGLLTAEVLVQVSRVGVQQPLPLMIRVANDGEEPREVASISLHAKPTGSAVVPALDYFGGPVPAPVLLPHGEVMLPASVTFLTPQWGTPRQYEVGAVVRFTGGAQIDAEPASINVVPIG